MDRLYSAILRIETEEECRRFFEDLCTINELISMSQRLKVAEMLHAGNNYGGIAAATGVSTATISRVNRAFMYGSGGYREILEKLGPEGEAE